MSTYIPWPASDPNRDGRESRWRPADNARLPDRVRGGRFDPVVGTSGRLDSDRQIAGTGSAVATEEGMEPDVGDPVEVDSGRKPLDIPGRAAAADRNPPLIGVPTGVFDGAWSRSCQSPP